MQVGILGIGMHLPSRVVPNSELEAIKELETSDEWIRERTGIESRHYAAKGQTGSDLAVVASKAAIADAGLSTDDIDFIIYATLSPDHYFPGGGVYLQDKLFNDRTIGALDVRDQCSGFLYSLTVADSLIKSGQYKHILVVGAEVHSTALDFTKRGRDLAVIFGDGAGAVVVGPAHGPDRKGMIASVLHSQGQYANELWTEYPSLGESPFQTHEAIDQGRHHPKMNGRVVFKHAVTRMIEVAEEILAKTGKTVADIDVFLPHQANLRINTMLSMQLGIPSEKVINTIQWTGNTTAATIPICMCEARKQGKLNAGDLVLMVAFGSGFTWAAALLEW